MVKSRIAVTFAVIYNILAISQQVIISAGWSRCLCCWHGCLNFQLGWIPSASLSLTRSNFLYPHPNHQLETRILLHLRPPTLSALWQFGGRWRRWRSKVWGGLLIGYLLLLLHYFEKFFITLDSLNSRLIENSDIYSWAFKWNLKYQLNSPFNI